MKIFNLPILLAVFLCAATSQAQSVVINELMASNSNAYLDNARYDDWIELFNSGTSTLDLGGHYLTDDPGNLTKFRLPSGTGQYVISPGGFLILFASGDASLGPKHLGFGLSGDGEQVFLVASDGATILDQIDFPKQRTDISYGRKTDGSSELVYISPSSPNAHNLVANSYIGFSSSPVFDVASGFYSAGFTLMVSTSEPGSEIYYTLDGSEPDKNNIISPGKSYQYKNQYPENPGQSAGPSFSNYYLTLKKPAPASIPISDAAKPDVLASISATYDYLPTYNFVPVKPVYKGTVVRAKVYAPGKLPSETVSKSYFFTPNGQPKTTLPVISIKTSPDNLFDYEKGIGVAGKDFVDWRNTNPNGEKSQLEVGNYYRASEVPANFELIMDGSSVLNQEVGLRVHGAGSRRFDKKSFRLYSTGANASESAIDYPIFPSQPFHTFKRLLLRNSGNDYERTLMKDAYIHQIAKGLNMELQDYRPAATFINGEYWGIHDIRERLDEYYFASHYALDADNIEFFADPDIHGNSGEYAGISSFVKTQDMTSQSNYDYAALRLDLDNLIDYSVLELYAANWDWPYGNVLYWRNKVPYNPSAGRGKDGRWRWALFDIDLSFEEYEANQFPKALGENGYPPAEFLLKYMLPNSTFKKKFINRYADLINSYFQPQRLIAQINACKNAISAELPENIKRWNRPSSYATWESNVNLMVNFANLRPSFARTHIQNQFGLTDGIRTITVNVSNPAQGYVRVNTIDILPETPGIAANPYPWSGVYFKNVPIQVTAIPKPGFKFVQWENLSTLATLTTPTIEFNPSSLSSYRAVFAVDVAPTMTPAPVEASVCVYQFTQWSSSETAGKFPSNMAFVYMLNDDPGLTSTINGFTNGVYNLTSRTRINGLGENGISFINTSNTAGNPGYPGLKLGGALLAINTMGKSYIDIKWTAGTVTANTRPYAIRLQYRIGNSGNFTDVLGDDGLPVEYLGNDISGHEQLMNVGHLPASAMEQPYVQLFWRYYCTDPIADGSRDELRLDNIEVQSCFKPLPVRLVNFDVKSTENHVALSWETSEELDNDHFEIERSINAKNWYPISRIQGNQTTQVSSKYDFTDENPLDGTSYYRLKQIDIDGFYMFSKIRRVDRALPATVNVFPNPVRDLLKISLSGNQAISLATIFDISGRKEIETDQVNPRDLSLPVSNLPPGLYVIQIQFTDRSRRSFKFAKE